MTDLLEIAMTTAQKGGPYVAPMLVLALVWMHLDRNRLLSSLSKKDAQIMDLSRQIITVAAELKLYLFEERRGGR